MEEQMNTEVAAPQAAQATEVSAAKPAVEQRSADVSSPANDGLNKEVPTDKPQASGQTGQNWEQEYKRIADLYQKREQSYNELRKKLNAQGSEKNAYAKELQDIKERNARIEEMLRKATTPQHDPAKFSEELSARGPEYILDLVKQHKDQIVGEYEKKLASIESNFQKEQNNRAVNQRIADPENYPNFKELSPVMAELYQANMEFFDSNYPSVDDRLDALYTATKLQHSQDAIKKAQELGKSQAEAELAREAHTGVAAGGKQTAPRAIDPSKMTSQQLRDYLTGSQ